MNKNKDFSCIEKGITKNNLENLGSGRIEQSLCKINWRMEKMRPGQGIKEKLYTIKECPWSWNCGNIPGDVYTDLYLAGEIDEPHFGRNMAKIKWVQEYEWWYLGSFEASDEMLDKNLKLVFGGIDYSCDIWFNQVYLGHHEGMFSSFEYDVTNLISMEKTHNPANTIAIKIDPPVKNETLVAGAKNNFIGDYLPGISQIGIWRPITLIGTTKAKIDYYRAEYIVNENNVNASFDVDITGYEENINNVDFIITLKDGDTKITHKKQIDISLSDHTFNISFDLENPKLWWPYELGEQFLYDLEIEIKKDDLLLDKYTDKTGIRQITMAMNPGFTKEESILPWTFKVNGKSMFLRSACWGGPPSMFYGRNSLKKYEYFLSKAKEANINNLRIFGWHPAEVKEFYDLCDKYGITVWTNFAFASLNFRDDKEYLELIEHEIKMTVKERRNHPSMIMFMGGEEVNFKDTQLSYNKKLMQYVGAIARKHTNIPYADASPLSNKVGISQGYATKESSHANAHYYAAGAVFMEDFYPNLDYCIIPELTAASSPSIESLKKFIPENELWPLGPSYGYHMADLHILQNLNYEVFGDTCMDSLEHFTQSTQIAQGVILQFALEHFRRQKPHVSGVSLCHFITNWPIIKWEIIDYYGKEKESFNYVKRCYNPILPSLEFKKRRWLPGETFIGNLFIINDYYKSYDDVTYEYEILNNEKETLKKDSFNISFGENISEKIGEISYVLGKDIDECFYITLKLTKNGEVISDNEYRLLIADQEKSKLVAYDMYKKMCDIRNEIGRTYYRYTPEMLEDL